MRIILSSPESDRKQYLQALHQFCPYADIRLWHELKTAPDAAEWQAEYALVWKPENELFLHQTELKAIFNLGAGIDALEKLPDLPADVPLYRLRDAGMGQWMLEYVLYAMVHFGRNFDHYRYHQARQLWQPELTQSLQQRKVGIMGLGPLGAFVGQQLSQMGYSVVGWSRSPKEALNFDQLSGMDKLDDFLSRCHFVVNLLPAKEETYHLLNEARLMRLPRGAVVVSVGRGSVIDEHALLVQLQTRHLRGAMLDVFEHEPLAKEHPFWQQDNLLITPHMAAPTQHDEAIKQILADILDIELGSDRNRI